jgi:dienelactone hydrolase
MVIKKLEELNSSKGGLQDIFNLEKIGIFGHSLGGATAGQMCFGNTSITAGINLDGFQFGDLHNNVLSVPFMFVSSNAESNQYLRALTFLEKSNSEAYQVAIRGFTHDNFTDLKFLTEGDVKAIELQRSVIKSFFDKYLKGLYIDLKDLEKDYPVLSIISNN